jgi:hypothetical protein
MNTRTRTKRGTGSQLKRRPIDDDQPLTFSVVLPPKHQRQLERVAKATGLENNSEIFRRLLDEKASQLKSRDAVFAVLDFIAANRSVRPEDVKRILAALNWRE